MADQPRALAVGAHQDDVEFGMAGTLALLGQAGYELHIMTVCKGDCGTAELEPAEIQRIRAKEAAHAAEVIGATYHPGICDDLEAVYCKDLNQKACAVVREVNPHIMLVPSYNDYMEDHSESARIMVMAAFCKVMKNFFSIPPRAPVFGDTYIYHAQPHGLRDAMNRHHPPELFVNVSSVIDQKEEMLRRHASQKKWLDLTQGMDAYLSVMRDLTADVARWSGRKWKYAEGWSRHCYLGFAARDADPLRAVLKKYVCVNPKYARTLNKPR